MTWLFFSAYAIISFALRARNNLTVEDLQIFTSYESAYIRFQIIDRYSSTENTEELRQNVLIFHHLRQASAALNDIFSIPVLLILKLKFMMIVGAAFAYIYSFYHSNNILENARCYIGFTFLTECVRILVVLTAADLRLFRR